MAYRDERLSATMRDELAALILRTVELPGALVTVTEVALTPKRDAAAVYVAVLPAEAEERSIAALAAHARSLRYALLKKLRIRVVPELFFRADHGPQNAAEVERLLATSELPVGEGDE